MSDRARNEPRKLPIYRAMTRDNLLMGGDRAMVGFLSLLCATLALTALNVVAITVALPMWVIGISVLRRMAKIDPKLRDVYVRHRRYAPYYAAARHPSVKE